MKRKDIATILVCVVIAAILSLIICSKFLSASAHNQKVEKVEPIASDFKLPDKAIFNTDAIDPTQLIQISPNSNNQPFVSK